MNCNITDFGAVADGRTLNTAAIQAAIDECGKGGGRVTVPAGVYKTGTVWLRSNVELHLELGAVLLASDNTDDYNASDAYPQNFDVPDENWLGKHLIIAHEIENTAITGLGTVNGSCHAFVDDNFENVPDYGWRSGKTKLKDSTKLRPGQLIVFIECKNVDIRDFTVVDSPCWSLFLHGCENVSVRGYKVKNPINMLNSDGLDIDSCRNVTVSDCIIDTGDDAIAIRCDEARLKNKDIHCENIAVTNCVLRTGVCAFRIGVGSGTIRHIRISNIVVRRCTDLVQFCTAYISWGCANISDVGISHISADETDRVINLTAKNGASVRDITLDSIRSSGYAMNRIDVSDGVIENITLRDIEMTFADRNPNPSEASLNKRGSHLLYVSGVRRLTLEKVKLNGGLMLCDENVVIKDSEISKTGCNF